MDRKFLMCAGLALAVAGCTTAPKTATSVVQDALKATGDVATIQITGSGKNGNVGQAILAGQEWPMRNLTSFTFAVNYNQHSARLDLNYAEPVFGGQQQNAEVNGDKAWNVGPNGPAPQLAAAEGPRPAIMLTPQGFLKGAQAAGNATLTENGDGTSTISFTGDGQVFAQGHDRRAEHGDEDRNHAARQRDG